MQVLSIGLAQIISLAQNVHIKKKNDSNHRVQENVKKIMMMMSDDDEINVA